MGITILEVLMGLFILYVVTQILVPLAFPKTFEQNWLFKKDKLRKQVDDIIRKRKETDALKRDVEDLEK